MLFKVRKEKVLRVLKYIRVLLLKTILAVWIFVPWSFSSVTGGWFQVTLQTEITEVLIWLVLRKRTFYKSLLFAFGNKRKLKIWRPWPFWLHFFLIVTEWSVSHWNVRFSKHIVPGFTEKVRVVSFIFSAVLKCWGHGFVLGFIAVVCFIWCWAGR